MPILYKICRSSLNNKEGLKLFHPRTVYVGAVNTEQIAREISEYSSLSKGDTKNVIDNLVTVMTKHLQASETVTLDGLGTFRIVMVSKGMGAKTGEEVSPAQASLRVRFSPAFTRNANRTVATRSFVDGARCIPYAAVAAAGKNSGAQTPGGGQGAESGGGSGLNPLD